jgi:hypothetical protein
MTPEQLAEVDSLILSGHMLRAIMSIRKHTGAGVKDAIDLHFERYKELRRARPADFQCTHEEYWREVYS